MSDEIDVAAPEVVDQPDNDAVAPGAPDQAQRSSGEESFTDFDPSSIPETGASPQWLKERYDQMNRDYTQKLQGFGETRRNQEQLQQIFDGIKTGDAQTKQSYLNLLGFTQEELLEAYGLELAEQEAAQEPEFDDLDFKDPRVDALLQEREAEQASFAEQAQEQEALQYADQEGGRMEEELTALYGGKEPSQEDAEIIFTYALEHPDQLGNPDVQAGFNLLKQRDEARQEEWLESRMGAPRATTSGVPGTERFDRSTKEGRIALGQLAAQEAKSGAR